MKQNRGLLIIVVILIIAVFGIISLFQAWNNFGGDSNKIVIENASFTNIDVLSDNAKVEIIPTNSPTTTVEYVDKKGKNAKLDFQANVKKDTLTVKLKKKRWRLINFDFSFSQRELLVKVPEKQYENIIVNNDNGKIKVTNMKAKDISFDTDNGNIELKNVDASSINVQSDNGRIIMEEVTGNIIGKTDNGQITLITNNWDRQIELTTDNGRIEIKTENEPTNATIDAKTDNGKIDVFGEKNEHTVFGKGKNLIKLKTDNGRITVTKL